MLCLPPVAEARFSSTGGLFRIKTFRIAPNTRGRCSWLSFLEEWPPGADGTSLRGGGLKPAQHLFCSVPQKVLPYKTMCWNALLDLQVLKHFSRCCSKLYWKTIRSAIGGIWRTCKAFSMTPCVPLVRHNGQLPGVFVFLLSSR